MKPQPPCGRHCPKRCAVPNCHDPAICGDWAAYQNTLAEWNAARRAEIQAREDYKAAKGRMKKLCESRERDKP